MKNTFKLLVATAMAVGLAATVQAVPITGTIDIGASLSHVVIDKTANTVQFVDDSVISPGNALVSNATGDFIPYVGSFANYANFNYNPLSVSNPLWSLVSTLASFDLTSITSVDESGAGLELKGAGMINALGFDPTPGTWSFSATTVSSKFTFSSQTGSVPDGGMTVMLLGAALSGLGLIRKKFLA